MFSGISSFDRRSLSATSFLCCPHCGCANIKKHGKEHGHQRWYCKDCHKTFAGRSDTILFSSKLKPGQLRRMLSLLSDGVLTHQIAHQVKVSIQTVILWKRKLQHLVKTQENIVLSGKIVVDETYIHVPAKERSKIRKRGLSKDLMPIVLLAYTLDGIIIPREDLETGEKTMCFAGEKNRMGRVSRWIPVGEDMIVTLKELSKMSRAMDAASLKKAVVEEMDANYKHIEKRKQLMLKLGETLDNVLLPLVNGNENNPVFAAFNKAAEKLCDDDLRIA